MPSVVRQRLLQEGRKDIRRQSGEVHRTAHLGMVLSPHLNNLYQVPCLAGLQDSNL
jgi:hypothetical protein